MELATRRRARHGRARSALLRVRGEVALATRDGRAVCPRCRVAHTPLARMRGMLGRHGLEPGEGMLIRPAPSVHSFFMRFPIDVVFLDADATVLKVVGRLRPWRAAACSRAVAVLELRAGAAEGVGLQVGDVLESAEVSSHGG